MRFRTVLLKMIIVLVSTLGIIVPVALWTRPPEGYRLPMRVGFTDSGTMPRPIKLQLSFLLRGIGEMEGSKDDALDAAQTRRILALVAPWRTRARMSDEEAHALHEKLNGVLNERQKRWLEKVAAGMPSGGPPGGSGGGFSDGQQRLAMQAFRQAYNPFHPPTALPEFKSLPERARERYKERYAERQKLLEQLARKAKSPATQR